MYKIKILENNIGQHTRARLGISLGQPYHEGEKLEVLCAWAAERFTHIEVMVADTLNIWNYNAGDTSISNWRTEGNAWLYRNATALSLLPSKTITRWDDYTGHGAYDGNLAKIMDLYRADKEFSSEIDTAANRIMIRRKKAETSLPFYKCYLFEECAVNALLGDAANIYPGSFIKIGDYIGKDISFSRVDFLKRCEKAA